jgi:hypothetical protein
MPEARLSCQYGKPLVYTGISSRSSIRDAELFVRLAIGSPIELLATNSTQSEEMTCQLDRSLASQELVVEIKTTYSPDADTDGSPYRRVS